MCIMLYICVTHLGTWKEKKVSILCEFRCADKMDWDVQNIYWGEREHDAGLTPVKGEK